MGSATTEQTETGRGGEPYDEVAVPRVWKLRVVYVAGTGIVRAEARAVRGPGSVTVGRGGSTPAAGRGLDLVDRRVSREHLRVYLQGSSALAEDLGSKNGSEVNGRRLRAGEPCALADGDVLRVGDSFLVIRHEPGTVPDADIPSLIGQSQAASKLRSAIALGAVTGGIVLLLGETGTGKGVASAAVHALSRRPGKFVAVNCAAVPATLAEGVFFGVKKGAYTGAVEQAGIFAEGHDGTVFLDEIGDLPIDLQPKLLHVIETKQVTPLGQSRPVPCDTRIIAATNRDLAGGLRAGTFREDLYHRLAGVVVHLPALRERREDILLLAAHLGGGDFLPSPALAGAMLHYPFPGNVREAAHIVCRVRALGEAEVIASLTAQTPNADASLTATPATTAARPPSPWQTGDPPPTREEIVALLTRYHGSVNRIEKEIGYSRRQFGRWVEQFGIDPALYRGRPDHFV